MAIERAADAEHRADENEKSYPANQLNASGGHIAASHLPKLVCDRR